MGRSVGDEMHRSTSKMRTSVPVFRRYPRNESVLNALKALGRRCGDCGGAAWYLRGPIQSDKNTNDVASNPNQNPDHLHICRWTVDADMRTAEEDERFRREIDKESRANVPLKHADR